MHLELRFPFRRKAASPDFPVVELQCGCRSEASGDSSNCHLAVTLLLRHATTFVRKHRVGEPGPNRRRARMLRKRTAAVTVLAITLGGGTVQAKDLGDILLKKGLITQEELQ